MSQRDLILTSSEKPLVQPVRWINFPEELRELDRFIGWRWIRNDAASNGNGRWDKRPVNIRTGQHASVSDSSSWCDLATALAGAEAGEVDGVGFVLGRLGDDRVVSGIDLDDCRDPATGALSPQAKVIVSKLRRHYWEVSPTGTGLKMLCYGEKPPGKCSNGHYEIYSGGRYFALTGHILEFADA
jgi:primase-polymerase (primpol)-like protein